MGNHSAAGQRAYKETRANGGSKSEAREAQDCADGQYYDSVKERQFGNGYYGSDAHDFNSTKNNGRWHDSDDY